MSATFPPFDYEFEASQLDDDSAPPGGIHGGADGVVLRCGSTIEPKPIHWLWPGWLARSRLHLLAGDPGVGKTSVAIALAATVTAGGLWPDGTSCAKGRVVFFTTEDDVADTVIPRLLACGGDPDHFYVVESTRKDGKLQPFDPGRDIDKLSEAIQMLGGASMLILDPVVTAVSGDYNSASDVRRGMQKVGDLASASGCVTIGITHFSKGSVGANPASRVVGSVSFGAVARASIACAKVKGADGEFRRLMVRTKANSTADHGGFIYELDQVDVLPGISAQRVEWIEAVEGEARDLLADAVDEPMGGTSNDVADMLRSELAADGWTNSGMVYKPLLAAGFSKKQIWTASKKLGVVRVKGPNGKDDGWYWRLPGGASDDQGAA